MKACATPSSKRWRAARRLCPPIARTDHAKFCKAVLGALTPIGDAAAMASAIAEAMQRIPDRRTLIDRGMQYTAAALFNDFSRS